jgi:hypothetical protein
VKTRRVGIIGGLVGLLGLAAALATVVAPASRAANRLEAIRPGEWYEVPNSKLREVLPSPPPPGDPRNIMWAWNGGTYDPVRDALILPAGGGHEDYGGNEVYAFSIGSLSWKRLTDPSPAPIYPDGQGREEAPDGRPASRHNYSGVAFLANVDKVFLTGGSLWSPAGGGSKGAWTFDVLSRTWQRRADPPGSQVTAMAAYDPVSGLAYALVQNGTLAAFDPKKNTWTAESSIDWAGFDPARTMVVHPTRRMLLVIGGGDVFGYSLGKSGAGGARAITTTGGDPIVNAQGPGVAYDPVADTLVGWMGGGDVYSLDLGTRKWTRQGPATGPVPGQAPHTGTFGRWQYVPSKDLFIGVSSIDENVWLYRPVRRGGPPKAAAPAGAGSGGAAPAPAAAPGSRLPLPERTWVSRPLGQGYGGPSLRPYGSKHTRLLYDSKRGRMVLTGGDYPNPHISDDGNQMVWALNLGDGPAPSWQLIGPWCNGPEQPGRPDTVLWVYDSKRDRGLVMPGFYFITQGEGSECPGVKDLPDPMFFDFATNKWQRVPFGPPPGTYGGDEGASFGVYDPVSDSVYRVRTWQDTNVMEILSLKTNRWSAQSLGRPPGGNREQSVIDVEGRSIYFINRYLKGLVRYSIRSGGVDVIPLPRQARPPQDEDLETYLAFDPLNRVVLYPNNYEYGGRMYGLGIYHVDTKKWEWEGVPAGPPYVQGNVLGFDVGNNVMLLYGGKDGSDIGLPTVYWLYRYGSGSSSRPLR